MAEGVRYIKIAKVDKDGNDQTTSLQSLSQIVIPYSTGNITYEILNITEKSTYFLYYVQNPNLEWADRAEIKYDFTGSLLTSSPTYQTNQDMTGAPDLFIKIPITSSTTDNLNFLNLNSSINYSNINPLNTYQLLTYPQETLLIEFSGSIMLEPSIGGLGTAGVGLVYIKENDLEPRFSWRTSQGNSAATFQTTPNTSSPVTASFHISASISASVFTPKDAFYPTLETYIFGGAQITASFTPDTYFSITSVPATGPTLETVPEPYFSDNFSLAYDCQPTFNNAITNRKSALHQDIDYNTGLLNPTNFELLINGTALAAEVQDSNYTSLRHINPRYNGSRSTSQKLNEWTVGDEGTYGKTPTVESLKTHVAYCDWIGGYPPEKMNASAAHVQYMIKDDGTILDPNTNKASLPTAQGTFLPNEKSRVKWDLPGVEEKVNIIRGGSNINMILYNQLKHPLDPPMSFTSSITLTDKGNPEGLVGDYQAILNKSSQQTIPTPDTWTPITYPNIYSSGSGLLPGEVADGYNGYDINTDLVNEGIDLTFKTTVEFYYPFSPNAGGNVIRLYNVDTGQQVGTEVYVNGDGFLEEYTQNIGYSSITRGRGTAELSITVPNSQLISGHTYRIECKTSLPYVFIQFPTEFEIQQTPSPTGTISTTGLFNRVPTLYTSSYRGVYITSSFFLSAYGTNAYQKDIPGSGFNSIQQPLSFKPGDEFRFEGDENKVYMVEKVEQGIFPFSPITGSIMIYFNKDVTSNTSSLNLNEFAIRRYVDDPSLIIFEGYKPAGSDGPYLFTPEFVSQDLDTDLNNYITNLTEKGLI